MKKAFEVRVEAKIPNLKVVVEAENHEEALQLGRERAREVIEKHLPENRKGAFAYAAVEAREMFPPTSYDA